MSDIRLHIAEVDFPDDAETREARHELLASFLGAYIDGELPAETASQIEAHLVGCARCRRELDVHRAVRDRLGAEPVPAASVALRERIAARLQQAPAPVMPSATLKDVPWYVGPRQLSVRAYFAAGAVLLLFIAAFAGWRWTAAETAAPAAAVSSRAAVPLFAAVLEDYHRVMTGDLPGRARDLIAVRAGVPFAFAPLTNPSLRLIAAWTTSLVGEPAAVLAYRWNDRVVLQYFVSDGLLFQSPNLRASLAQKRAVSAIDGAQGMLLWAEPEYGSVLVGDLSPNEIATLRNGNVGR